MNRNDRSLQKSKSDGIISIMDVSKSSPDKES